MKNFDWIIFIRKIVVKVELFDIYSVWIILFEIEKWFLSKVVFMDAVGKIIGVDKQVEKGYIYEWNWYLFDEIECGRIVEVNGVDFVQFIFVGECFVDIKFFIWNDYVLVELI